MYNLSTNEQTVRKCKNIPFFLSFCLHLWSSFSTIRDIILKAHQSSSEVKGLLGDFSKQDSLEKQTKNSYNLKLCNSS